MQAEEFENITDRIQSLTDFMPKSTLKTVAEGLIARVGMTASGTDLFKKIKNGTANIYEYVDFVSDAMIVGGSAMSLSRYPPLVRVGDNLVNVGKNTDLLSGLLSNSYQFLDENNWELTQIIQEINEKIPLSKQYHKPLTTQERQGLANQINSGNINYILYSRDPISFGELIDEIFGK